MPQPLASTIIIIIEGIEVAVFLAWVCTVFAGHPSLLGAVARRCALGFRGIRERIPVIVGAVDFSPCVAILTLEVARHTLLSFVTVG